MRRVFCQHLTQALKTKTGAGQPESFKRIFSLAVRSLRDEALAELIRQMDYTPRGMTPAYYLNTAEHIIVQLSEQGSMAGRGAGLAWLGRHPERETDRDIERKTRAPALIKSVIERMVWG